MIQKKALCISRLEIPKTYTRGAYFVGSGARETSEKRGQKGYKAGENFVVCGRKSIFH